MNCCRYILIICQKVISSVQNWGLIGGEWNSVDWPIEILISEVKLLWFVSHSTQPELWVAVVIKCKTMYNDESQWLGWPLQLVVRPYQDCTIYRLLLISIWVDKIIGCIVWMHGRIHSMYCSWNYSLTQWAGWQWFENNLQLECIVQCMVLQCWSWNFDIAL